MPARLPLLLRLLACLVAGLMTGLATLDLDRADKIASVAGAVIACAAFAISFIRPPTDQPAAGPGKPEIPAVGRDAHVSVRPDRTTTLAVFGLPIVALTAITIIAIATVALRLPQSRATGPATPLALGQSSPPAPSRPASESTGDVAPKATGRAPEATDKVPEPDGTAATPRPTKAKEKTPPAGLAIAANRWVDFDQLKPEVIPAKPSEPITDAVDLRVGPDNLDPVNNAENWFKQSESCAAEHASSGLPGELGLKQPLAAKHGAPIEVCLYTSGGAFYTLRISTTHADGGGDPYHFAITREPTQKR